MCRWRYVDMMFEQLLFENNKEADPEKVFVLIIYDIIDNRKRNKLAKLLEGYGFRIQKSAFEAMLTKSKYKKLLTELEPYGTTEDSVRIYKIIGKGQVTVFGEQKTVEAEEVILI